MEADEGAEAEGGEAREARAPAKTIPRRESASAPAPPSRKRPPPASAQRYGEFRRELTVSGRLATPPPASGESEEEGGDAEGDAPPAPAPQPMTYLMPMGGPLAPLVRQVLRDRAPSGSVRCIGNARPSSVDKKTAQWMDSILSPHSDEKCVAEILRWPHGPGGWGSRTRALARSYCPPRDGTRRVQRPASPIGSAPARGTVGLRPAHRRRRRPAWEPMADRRSTRPTHHTHKPRVAQARGRDPSMMNETDSDDSDPDTEATGVRAPVDRAGLQGSNAIRAPSERGGLTLGTGPRGTASTGSFSMTPDLGSESCCVLPRSPSTACRARSTADPPTDGGDAWGGAHADASQERPTTPPSHGGPVAIEAIQGILQDEHEDQHTFLDGQWSAADHFLDPLPLLGTDLDDARVRNDASIVESRHDNMAGQRRVADARQAEVWRGRRRAATRPPRPMHTTPGEGSL